MSKVNSIQTNQNRALDCQFYLEQARAFQKQEKWADVIACCASSLEIQHDNLEVYDLMCHALVRMEKWEDAIDTGQAALEIDPSHIFAFHNIALALTYLGKTAEADTNYQKIFQIDPSFAENHLNRFDVQRQCGDFFFRTSDWDQAISAYRKAIVLQPKAYWEHINLGRSLYQIGEVHEAVEALRKAISLNHRKNGAAHYHLAEIYYKQEEFENAVELAQKAAGLMPEDSAVKSLLAQIHAKKSRHDLAINSEPDSVKHEPIDKIPGWEDSYNRGKNLQLEGKLNPAIRAYHQAIIQNPLHSWSYHDLGDANLKLNQWYEAIAAYRQSIKLNPDYFWSTYNLGVAYRNIGDWESAVQLYKKSIALNPALNLPTQALEETLRAWYDSLIQKGNQLLRSNKQEALQCYRKAIRIYADNIHLPIFDIPREKNASPRVLLVVDDHLTQCLRYRVTQKVEQLEYAGFSPQWYSWTRVKEGINQIAFFDIVIFYRVPAFPEVIQAILYAKRIKKIVFYEIDDLIFEPDLFPDPIESYGGQVSQEQYDGLVRGTVLFQEAMRLCDLAIASTPLLQKQMEKVVGKGNCYLHRNALDSYNLESLKLDSPKVKRDYISIFYGSGTKAHNSDFDELVAPALAQILEKYPNVRLTLMGYLKVPAILETYQSQIDRVDIVKDILVYYEFLKQADISIAVLHPTTVNSCKSELKWFEAATFKIPCVVSNTEVYLDVIKPGQDGLIAASPDEWFIHLESLVKDEKSRNRLGQTAYQRVMREYSVPVMAENLSNICTAGVSRGMEAGELVPSTPRKKLLIVNVFYPPQSIGGATRVVKDNVDILNSKYSDQYEVSVFTSDEGNQEPYQITEYSHEGVHVIKVSTPMMEGMDWQYNNPRMYEIFKEYLEVSQPDLIHFHCIQRLTASVLEAAGDMNIPFIVTAHDAWWISDHQFLVNEQGSECNHQQNDPVVSAVDSVDITSSIQRKNYLRKQLNRAAAVLAVSEAFTEIYQQNGFPKTQANRNGIQPQPITPRIPSRSGKVRLAHIGGMAAHKGYFLFKEAVENANLKNCEIIVINHAQSPGTIEYDDWNGVPVKFLAKFKQENIYDLYSMIDVLVAPSMWPESFGLVTREAAAAEVWVIASDKGAIGEDLINGVDGHVISVDSSDSLITALQEIDSNPAHYLIQRQSSVTSVRQVKEQISELSILYNKIITN